MSKAAWHFRPRDVQRAIKVADNLGKPVKNVKFEPGGGFVLEFGEANGNRNHFNSMGNDKPGAADVVRDA